MFLFIVLTGCETTGIYKPYKPAKFKVSYKHPSGGYYTSTSLYYTSADYEAKLKCRNANPDNPSGCIVSTEKFKNNLSKIDKLQTLINDYESGKISKYEFEKKKKELIKNKN